MSVGDSAASQIVRGEFYRDPIAGHNPDAKASHTAGGIAKRFVSIVEDDAVHAAAESFNDLAFHLDILFLCADSELLVRKGKDGRAMRRARVIV